jgi:formate dehydrogenase major subunit
MTNQWTDLIHATLVLIFSNPAENHPGSSVWVMRALNKPGTKAYVIDPRRTRMAAIVENKGGKHIRIRPGTDIAFMNGIMRYVISKIEDGTIPAANYLTYEFDPYYVAVTKNRGALYRFDLNDGSPTFWPGVAGMKWPAFTDAGMLLNAARNDYKRYGVDTNSPDPADVNYQFWIDNPSEFARAMATNLPVYAGDITHPDSVFQYVKSRVAPYDPATVVDICGRVYAGQTPFFTDIDFQQLCDDVVANAWAKSAAEWGDPNYRATTILYAMGTTQHTHGSQNIRTYAMLQMLCGNMGKAGGGVNALRGIGNVQGSTDMGLLRGLIPGYSAPPGSNYLSYVNSLFGNSARSGLQQNGFKNMTFAFFMGDPTNQKSDSDVNGGNGINDPVNLFGYWPGTGSTKVGGTTSPGLDHRTMFVQMNPDNPGYNSNKPRIKALVCLGMNPVQSESNSGIFRKGLEGLELLVVSDMFLSETAEAKVGSNTEVYFLPAAGFAEKCGTFTNSSRVIQWKWQVAQPKGSSKTDLEILFLLAYELIQQDALNVNTNTNPGGWSSKDQIWDALFASQYGLPANPWTGWSNEDYRKDVARNNDSGYAERVFKQFAKPLGSGGTLWIVASTPGWNETTTVPVQDLAGVPGAAYATPNYAQRRNPEPNTVPNGPYIYPKWGTCWLVNRRIFYNMNAIYDANEGNTNKGVPGDAFDLIVGPDKVARFFVHQTNDSTPTPVPYSTTYRSYFKLAETYGRTPIHEEPKESPRPDLAATFPSLGEDSVVPYGSPTHYPLVLTTHRYVEHYQGGPMSRNVAYLTELVPEPILEISEADAAKYGLVNGGLAYVKTARSAWAAANGITDPYLTSDGWVGPFRVRVFPGTKEQGRVARGIVAIPFHWGSKGLNTGPSVNLLTNDAQDPNTWMPESKSCLCAVKGV